MGWFWSDSPSRPTAPHPLPQDSNASPPPGCPMHTTPPQEPSPPQSCPVKHQPLSPQPPSSSTTSSTLSKLNPLNYMPTLSNARAANQRHTLPTEREISSIPRGDADTNWEYPSPQQMYNALLRKGGLDDDQAGAVESMVAVHNFLNEGAWNEIRGWEKRFAGGLRRGWQECLKGEQQWALEDERREGRFVGGAEPKLLRFMGRPRDMTPKATVLQWMGWAWPSTYGTEPPFDRHDWFVQRQTPDGGMKEVRYVIDYYSGPPEPTGEPVFYLDVRPAVDTPSAAVERLMRYGGDVWYRASGASTRA